MHTGFSPTDEAPEVYLAPHAYHMLCMQAGKSVEYLVVVNWFHS